MAEKTQTTVALGVTGSIAAYKAADLCSKLVQNGFNVVVLMTESAQKLVTAQTFLTLSKNPVITDLWEIPNWQPGHIALADQAELLIVAPCTANFIGKYTHGIADDALSTYALSHTGKVLLAPAMNPKMWKHPAVQANCEVLKNRGVEFIGPEPGRVACGSDSREGRMSEPTAILDKTQSILS
jgi:phosphopantothenoylcysteine synthetase/decarboxylase